jgi:hypothetical protein
MALRNTQFCQSRSLPIALAVAASLAGVAASCGPASAQYYWGDRYPSDRYYQQAPQRDFFPFFGGRYNRPPPVVDSSKAPPPRKLETPPTTNLVVIGDSLADWLAYGLDELYADQPDIGVERKIRATSGLIRYDAKNDQLDWAQITKDALAAEKPNAIIIMLGLNDRVPMRDKAPPRPEPQRKGEQPAQSPASQNAAQGQQGQSAPPTAANPEAPTPATAEAQRPAPRGSYDFHTDRWAELYAKRVDEMIAAVKSRGVPVLWMGLPALRGTKSTGDMSYLDELYRERAEKAGIVYVDIWDGFVDEQGRYAVQGPDFEGQTRRLRTADGVHFTKAGAVKLASYVDRDLRRILSSHVSPVALPGPEVNAPKPGGPRPAIGPVLPLTASSGGEGGDLLGAGSRPAPTSSDPVAAEVLSRGDPLAAPHGRADDFSWPRPVNDANTADVAPEPAALTPVPAKKGATGKNDAKKPGDAKADGKTKPDTPAARRSPSASLDGAPRPPKSVGGGF